MSSNKISLSFPKEKEEEISVFPLEDLIKEYNYKILKTPVLLKDKKFPLSLSHSHVNSDKALIRPLTEQEHAQLRYKFQGNDWWLLEKILKDQMTTQGLIGNIPNVAAGVTVVELLREFGLKGQIYYKTVEGKIYVILKGPPGQRNILTGTRYLNTNPQIVQFGLAKVTVKDAVKSGFKVSFIVYGVVKAVDAMEMILKDEGLKASFFGSLAADLPKLSVGTLITAAAGGVVAMTALPVAVGAGIVLAVSVTTGIALEYLDQKTGFTQKISEGAETLWKNLNNWWNTPSQPEKPYAIQNDPLSGLIFGGGLVASRQRVVRMNGSFVYTA